MLGIVGILGPPTLKTRKMTTAPLQESLRSMSCIPSCALAKGNVGMAALCGLYENAVGLMKKNGEDIGI